MRRALTLVSVVSLAVACSSGSTQPKPSAFAPGSCRSLAPSVLELGRDLDDLKGKKTVSAPVAASLKSAQTTVRSFQPGLDPTLAPMVQTLVTTIGVLRIRSDTNTYDPSLRGTALTAYQALLGQCIPKKA